MANNNILLKQNGDQYDTINFMKKYAILFAKHPFYKKFISQNNITGTKQDLEKIFNYVYYNTYYKKDPNGKQQIRSGTRLLKDKFGNCVDYSVIFSSFLLNLGIPHKMRMIATKGANPEDFSHIYVITDNNIVMDAVLGQDQNGNEFLKSKTQRTPFFNTEANYINKYDLKVL